MESKKLAFIPLFVQLGVLAAFLYWIVSTVYLLSVDPPTYSSGSIIPRPNVSAPTRNFILVELFGLLWNIEVFQGFGIFIISYVCATWFFTQKDKYNTNIFEGITTVLFYHLGSIIFGSLIVAIVAFIRIVITFLIGEDAKEKEGQNAIAACLLCCLKCIEDCVRRFTQFAIIMIAISGKSFCSAAGESISIITNTKSIGIILLGGCGSVFSMLLAILIAAGSSYSDYLILTYVNWFSVVQYQYIMIGICFFIAFFVGMSFATIFGVATDTILFSYCYAETLRTRDVDEETRNFEANYQHLYDINEKIESMENPDDAKK